MLKKAIYERRFEKEVKIAQKRGFGLPKLQHIMQLLLEGKALSAKNRNHKLHGDFIGYWECHIEPDWLLIYKKSDIEIVFARTGTHADLF